MVNAIRAIAISTMRSLPRFRGFGKLALAFNAAFLRGGANPVVTIRMLLGHRLVLDARVQSQGWAIFSGQYSDGEIRVLTSCMTVGGGVLDVGANIGFYTVPLATAAKRIGGRVVAFEPYAPNCARLKENLKLNDLEDYAEVFQMGLSSHSSEAELSLRQDFDQGSDVGNASIVIADGQDDQYHHASIKLAALDDLWPSLNIRHLDAVKIDIEGHEDLFLEGAHNTLAVHRPVILMEVNRWFYARRQVDFDAAIQTQLPHGYRVFRAIQARIRLTNSPMIAGMEEVPLSACSAGDIFLIPNEKVDRFHAVVERARRDL